MGVEVVDVKRIDAIYRIMAHKIPGSANHYVKLRPEQLRPVTDAVRAQLWPGAPPVGSRRDDLRLIA